MAMSNALKRVMVVVMALAFIAGMLGYLLISQGVERIYASNGNAVNPRIGAASSGDWTMYKGDLGRSGFNAAETTITPANASVEITLEEYSGWNYFFSSDSCKWAALLGSMGWD